MKNKVNSLKELLEKKLPAKKPLASITSITVIKKKPGKLKKAPDFLEDFFNPFLDEYKEKKEKKSPRKQSYDDYDDGFDVKKRNGVKIQTPKKMKKIDNDDIMSSMDEVSKKYYKSVLKPNRK